LIRRKQHWKTKSSSGYAISVGRVSVWKLHWFGGSSKIYINLLIISLILNDMIEHVYRKIFMITNVARLKISSMCISLRPQMVGDIDMVWLLRRVVRNYMEEVVWWFFYNVMHDILNNKYYILGQYMGSLTIKSFMNFSKSVVQYGRLFKPFVSRRNSIISDFKSFISITITSMYSRNIYSDLLLDMLKMYTSDKSIFKLFKLYTGIYYIKYKINYLYSYYLFLLLYILSCKDIRKQLHIIKHFILSINLKYSYIVSHDSNIMFYMYRFYNIHDVYTGEIKNRGYLNIFIKYILSINSSWLYKKVCQIVLYIEYEYSYLYRYFTNLMKIYSIGCVSFFRNFCVLHTNDFSSVINILYYKYLNIKFNYSRNNIITSSIPIKQCINTHILLNFINFYNKDLYLANVYGYIDIFYYYYGKSMYYRGFWYYNVSPRGSIVLIHFIRRIYMTLYLYLTYRNISILKPIKFEYFKMVHKLKYFSEYKYKLSLNHKVYTNPIKSTWTKSQKFIHNFYKITMNTKLHFIFMLWNSYLQLLHDVYINIRTVIEKLYLIFYTLKYKYYNLFNYINKSKYLLGISCIWKFIIQIYIKKSKLFYSIFIQRSNAFKSYKIFRNWIFGRITICNKLLSIIAILLLRVKRYPTLKIRHPRPEPNSSAKLLSVFFFKSLEQNLYRHYCSNLLYNSQIINLYKYYNTKMVRFIKNNNYNSYKSYIKYISGIGMKFHKQYFIDSKSNTFYLYNIYRKLINYYNSVGDILLFVINLFKKVNKLLYRYKYILYLIYNNFKNDIVQHYYIILIKRVKYISKIIIQSKYVLYMLSSRFNKSIFGVVNCVLIVEQLKISSNTFKALGSLGFFVCLKERMNYLYKIFYFKLIIYREYCIGLLHNLASRFSIVMLFTSISIFREFYCFINLYLWKLSNYTSLSINEYISLSSYLVTYFNYSVYSILYIYTGSLYERGILNYKIGNIYTLATDDIHNYNKGYWMRYGKYIKHVDYRYMYHSKDTYSYIFSSLFGDYIQRWYRSYIQYLFNIKVSNDLNYNDILSNIELSYKYLS